MHRLSALVLTALIATCLASTASAFPALQKAFFEEYVNNHKDAEFAKYVKTKVKCMTCHQGKDRKHRNPYGEHLAELIDAKKDGKNAAKLKEALKKVAAMHSKADDDKSPTYGELIADSKLPGGTLEEVMKEPKDDEKDAGEEK